MTYKELLNLYKNGELSEKQREEIEKELEKQEAISEYLFDNGSIPEFSEVEFLMEERHKSETSKDTDLLKMIRKSIRNAFIKAGVVVSVVVLVLVIVTSAALPCVVDAMYYDPSKIVGEINGTETNRMTLDTMVYSELFSPQAYRTKVEVKGEGFGEYSIHSPQNFSYTGQFRDVNGTITKGKMKFFDEELFELPEDNAFVPCEIDDVISSNQGFGAAGDEQSMEEAVSEMDKDGFYTLYVTLDMVMTYDEFVRWSKDLYLKPQWCAICTKQEGETYVVDDILGFNFVNNGGELGYDNEEYPYLNYCDVINSAENYPEECATAEVMETHVISMLRYMKEQKSFNKMVGPVLSDMKFDMYADNIACYGLNIYGFVVSGRGEDLLEFSTKENVKYVYAKEIS